MVEHLDPFWFMRGSIALGGIMRVESIDGRNGRKMDIWAIRRGHATNSFSSFHVFPLRVVSEDPIYSEYLGVPRPVFVVSAV